MSGLRVIEGDITTQDVDAIVNASNESLSDGAGVNGAIHVAAGSELDSACREVAPCPTGEACITPGFRLPARFIIHTVGPVWNGGSRGEDALLTSCYRESLKLAAGNGIETIAFCSISTGIFGFPLERAARIAMRELRAGLKGYPAIRGIRMVCWGEESLLAHQQALEALA